MALPERFDRTEPWGTIVPDESSGVRVRPSTVAMPPAKAVKHTETVPLARPSAPSAPPPSLAAPVRTAPLARPLRPRVIPSSPPPPVVHPSVHAAVQAAVHASVQASVAAVLASAHVWRAPAAVDRDVRDSGGLAPAWTTTQRFYVLGTTVALAVITTLLLQLAIGGPEAGAAASAPRAARVASLTSPAPAQSAGSALRKDPAFVAAGTETALQPVVKRPVVPVAQPSRPVAASAGGGSSSGASTGTAPSSAKLDEAARSAKMLREQLSSAVN